MRSITSRSTQKASKLERSFLDDLGANDLDDIELVMAFEEAFAVEVPDEDAAKIREFRTYEEAVRYIHKLREGEN